MRLLLARFYPCCWRRSRAVPNRRANKDHFERIGALAAYAEYGKGQKAMVVLPLSEVETNRVWVPDDQLREITSPVSKLRRKSKRMCMGPQPGQPACAIV